MDRETLPPTVPQTLPRLALVGRAMFLTAALWLAGAAAAPAMAVAVSAGQSHTCGIDRANAALCWGSNAQGELGDGTRLDRAGPVAVQGLGSVAVASIQAGQGFSCALLQDRSVHCWGRISGGLVARPVVGLPPVLQISAGTRHACALAVAGDVYCWGDASRGQLGAEGAAASAAGTTAPPVRLAALSGAGVARVVAGGDATCAVAGGGQVLCLGTADWLPAAPDPGQPRQVPGVADALDMAAHEGHACVLRRAGQVACWGRNEQGQSAPQAAPYPVAVAGDVEGLQPALSISVGAGVSCAVQATRRIRCWGAAALLGAGNDKNPRWAGQVVGITDAERVSAGGTHACAVLEGGYVQCWGANDKGQLGGGNLCDAHLAWYLDYTDYSPRFNIGPCVSYTFGITPHAVQGLDTRSDALLLMNWVERNLPDQFAWSFDVLHFSHQGYYFRPYLGDRTILVTAHGTPRVFYAGPEPAGGLLDLGPLSYWMRQLK